MCTGRNQTWAWFSDLIIYLAYTYNTRQLLSCLIFHHDHSLPRRSAVENLRGVPFWVETVVGFPIQPIRCPTDMQVGAEVMRILRDLCAQCVKRAVGHVELRARALLITLKYLIERLQGVTGKREKKIQLATWTYRAVTLETQGLIL
jgi:hypothetical protein